MQAMVAKAKAHTRSRPNNAPAVDAVVTVPGPIKAADITDQNRMLKRPFFSDSLELLLIAPCKIVKAGGSYLLNQVDFIP